METLFYLIPNGLKYGHKRDRKALQRSSANEVQIQRHPGKRTRTKERRKEVVKLWDEFGTW